MRAIQRELVPAYFHPNTNVSAFSGSYHSEEEEHLDYQGAKSIIIHYQGAKYALKYTVKIFINTHFVSFFGSRAVVPSVLN